MSNCKLALMLTSLSCNDEDVEDDVELQAGSDVDQPAAADLATALPVIIRGMPPHWVKKPHQEQTPAMMMMLVAGSFLPPPHQGLLLPRSLLLTSSLFREFGGSSISSPQIPLLLLPP